MKIRELETDTVKMMKAMKAEWLSRINESKVDPSSPRIAVQERPLSKNDSVSRKASSERPTSSESADENAIETR